jgi:hypothetical protein
MGRAYSTPPCVELHADVVGFLEESECSGTGHDLRTEVILEQAVVADVVFMVVRVDDRRTPAAFQLWFPLPADGNRAGVDHRIVDEKGMRLVVDPSAVDDVASHTKNGYGPVLLDLQHRRDPVGEL